MSALGKPAPVTVEDYLEGELVSQVKHEYLGGEVHAMAGGSNRHNEIALNTLLAFGTSLRGKPCRPFNSDTKVRIQLFNHTRFYYPDAMVVCDKNRDEDQWQDRPVAIVEVLSESTRRTALAVHRRSADGGFVREDYAGLDAVILLPEIDSQLALAEVYEGLKI